MSADSPRPELEAAFETLRGALTAFVLRHTRDRAGADDIVQDIFVRALQHRDQLRDDAHLTAWIWQIARNAVVDAQRTPKAKPLAEAEVADLPREHDVQREVASWLTGFMDALPAHHAEALRLADIEGLPQKEVAQRLGLGLSAAKSRIQRGRALLGQALLRCCELERDARGRVTDYRRKRTCGCDQ